MLDTFKSLVTNQLEATLCTVNACIDRCPDVAWNSPVANYRFCRVVFHTLFFADYYLGQDESSFQQQSFHRDNQEFFGDYEEFEDRPPVALYDKPSLKRYLEHCRTKGAAVLAAETTATLQARAGFPRRACSRAELYVYNIRHIQHHAAQLSLRLRLDFHEDIPWIAHAWRDL
jgi:hypothetical protein